MPRDSNIELTRRYGKDRGSQYGEVTSNYDFYPTPVMVCKKVLNRLKEDGYHPPYNLDRKPTFLDPGSGNGSWGVAVRDIWRNSYLTGIELRKVLDVPINVYDEWITGDFLTHEFKDNKFDMIVGNPPFKLAEEFIRRSYSLLVPDAGTLVFLLRLSFLESQKRYHGLFKELPPTGVYVSSKRIKFFPGPMTTTVAHAFFVWRTWGYTDTRGTTLKWIC